MNTEKMEQKNADQQAEEMMELEIEGFTEKEAKEKVQSHLKVLLKSLEEKGVQISENHVKINIQKNVCTSSGTLLAVEKAGKKVPTDILPQQTERNFDINE